MGRVARRAARTRSGTWSRSAAVGVSAAWAFSAVLLTAHPGASQTPDHPARLTVEAGAAQRGGDLRWNIGFGAPDNIISELTYSEIEIREGLLGATVRLWSGNRRDVLITADGRLGGIAAGTSRDSDYGGANRTKETARSLALLTGTVARGDAAIGVRQQLRQRRLMDDVALWLGVQRSRQAIRMRDGVRVIPDSGRMIGLDSRYTASWEGPWLAVDAGRRQGPLRIAGRVAGHWTARYHGEGEWNLRRDLAQPLSFVHTGEGHGLEARLRGSYTFAAGPTLAVQAQWLRLRLERGEDQLFLAARPWSPGHPPRPSRTIRTNLHEVVWKEMAIQLTLSGDF